jgi:hypothetical protein
VQLLAATANLVVKADIHPAIVTLLLKHARDIHSPPGLLQAANSFPAPQDHALPIHPMARRFYDSGPPLLQRYLPFWLAVLIDRLFVMLLPLFAVVIPLSKVIPAIYNWRMRAGLSLVRELKFLEAEIDRAGQDGHSLAALDTFWAGSTASRSGPPGASCRWPSATSFTPCVNISAWCAAVCVTLRKPSRNPEAPIARLKLS